MNFHVKIKISLNIPGLFCGYKLKMQFYTVIRLNLCGTPHVSVSPSNWFSLTFNHCPIEVFDQLHHGCFQVMFHWQSIMLVCQELFPLFKDRHSIGWALGHLAFFIFAFLVFVCIYSTFICDLSYKSIYYFCLERMCVLWQ